MTIDDQSLLLGIDIGTTGTKCAVYDLYGKIIARAYQEYPMIHPQDGWTEQDPHRWWDAVQTNLKKIFEEQKVNSSRILSIGLSCTNAVALVDQNGEPIYNAIGHQDCRADQQVEWLKKHMNEEEVAQIAGNRIVRGSFFLPSIRWIIDHYPESTKHAYKILMPSGYIIQKLTGVFSMNKPRASFSLLCDIETGSWHKKLIKEAQIPPSLLPDTYNPYDIVGHVTKQAAEMTGLQQGTPVSAGCLDTVASTLASGAVDPGDVALTIGSSGRICYIDSHPATDHRILTAKSPYDGLYTIIQSTDNAGVSLRWFRDIFKTAVSHTAHEKITYQYIDDIARKVPAGSGGLIYLPYLNGEKSPIWNANARAVFFGVSLETDFASMARSIMEGVAFSIRDCLTQMPSILSANTPIPIGGGSSQSLLWCQIFADVLNHPILQLPTEETETLGDMIIAAQSVGIHDIDRYFGKKLAQEGLTIYPTPDTVSIYNEGFQKYKKLYQNVKALY